MPRGSPRWFRYIPVVGLLLGATALAHYWLNREVDPSNERIAVNAQGARAASGQTTPAIQPQEAHAPATLPPTAPPKATDTSADPILDSVPSANTDQKPEILPSPVPDKKPEEAVVVAAEKEADDLAAKSSVPKVDETAPIKPTPRPGGPEGVAIQKVRSEVVLLPEDFQMANGGPAASKRPQIVLAVHSDKLFLAWQARDTERPAGKIVVAQVAVGELKQGVLRLVRELPSLGMLAGFTVDAAGADYVLTAKDEELDNKADPVFVDTIHGKWRTDAVTLFHNGQATNLNISQNTDLPFYGVCNRASGRLVTGKGQVAALFSRRRYAPRDGLVHQEACALVGSPDLSEVSVPATNRVSHSFDQRLLFDGQDFVALHQADQYPRAGLLIEKLGVQPQNQTGANCWPVFSCPTFGNAMYFELGGIAVESDGYPVLFIATRNTEAIKQENVEANVRRAWDVAFAYVRRDFNAKTRPTNPYDILESGILARGYGTPEKFTVSNYSWNPKTSDWTNVEQRDISRQVQWLTNYGQGEKTIKKAASAKLIKLGPGKHVALWEEHERAGLRWRYLRTCGAVLTIAGDLDHKQVMMGPVKYFPDVRVYRGDDPVSIDIGGVMHAAWVTAGPTGREVFLHTLDENLKYAARRFPLR